MVPEVGWAGAILLSTRDVWVASLLPEAPTWAVPGEPGMFYSASPGYINRRFREGCLRELIPTTKGP